MQVPGAKSEDEPIPAAELQALVVATWEVVQELRDQVANLQRRVRELEQSRQVPLL